jgi:hypothetical protein
MTTMTRSLLIARLSVALALASIAISGSASVWAQPEHDVADFGATGVGFTCVAPCLIQPGTTLSTGVLIANFGPATPTATITFTLTGDVAHASLTPPPGVECHPSATSPGSLVVVCVAPRVPPGTSLGFGISQQVFNCQALIHGTVTITSDKPDPDPHNNTYSSIDLIPCTLATATPTPVAPEVSPLWLFLSGLLAFVWLARQKQRSGMQLRMRGKPEYRSQ